MELRPSGLGGRRDACATFRGHVAAFATRSRRTSPALWSDDPDFAGAEESGQFGLKCFDFLKNLPGPLNGFS